MSFVPEDPVGVNDAETQTRPSSGIARGVAIKVEGLSKRYRIGESQEKYKTLRDTIAGWAKAPLRRVLAAGRSRAETQSAIWALEDVSFEVRHGDVVGIIGRNGAGKSTLLKILSRITEPTRGRAELHGRVGSLLEVGTGFHQELTGRDNIYLNGAILGMKRAEIQSKFDEIVAFAEIDKFIDTAVKHYSSGMYLRLAFAVAAHLEPEILLVDEVLAVGDNMFQKKCLGKMEDVARTGRTVLFVSHNMAAVRTLCSTGVVLNDGRVAETGDIGRCIETYFKQIGAFQSSSDAGDGTPSAGFGRIVVNGNQTNSVPQSEPLSAETTFRLGIDASGFSLFMIVTDVYDRTIFHLREESPVLGIDSISPTGIYKVKVTVPPLWLNPGVYSVHFKVLSWGNFNNARKESDKAPIDVTGEYSRVGALLHPPAEWRVVKPEEQ
ncbi:MAG: polysaccharide ABC transporter ATP-binding protein [Acidobacteriota bacterium]|nr:polysaccharide ABC transporter ATP-binding protein [Acidobacteriota bacterium]